MRLFYLTRTYIKEKQGVDAGNIRNVYVNLLRKKYDVTVVTLGDSKNDTYKASEDLIEIPYPGKSVQWDLLLERTGIREDYLDNWVNAAFDYLRNIIKIDDIVFATTGGELGCVKLAGLLKKHTGCKCIINFHDPINYTKVNGKLTGGRIRIHVSRDKLLERYIRVADLIITSSDSYKTILQYRFPDISERIHNCYFGYNKVIYHKGNRERSDFHILTVYGGALGNAQRAEKFAKLLGGEEDIEVLFVGSANARINRLERKYSNISSKPAKPYSEYIEFMMENADVGLVSLYGEEWGACVPSKIFELINMEIPIYAILPDGDAKDIVDNKYGVVVPFYDLSRKSRWNELMRNYSLYKKNMRRDKDKWYSGNLIQNVYSLIEGLY